MFSFSSSLVSDSQSSITSCCLLGSWLVICKSKTLQLFSTYPSNSLLLQLQLHSVITSSESIQINNQNFLLLSFNDAKISILQYSPLINSLSTISIHYYERSPEKDSLLCNLDSCLYVDPQSRVAILKCYNNKLAILPFKSDDEYLDSSEPYLPSHFTPSTQIHPSIKNITDLCFLTDYFEPTLAILFESMPTWTGHLSARKDTKSVMVVSLNTASKNYSILYRVDNLPYNCFSILSVPSPTGGIICLSPNGIIHVDQACTPAAIAVNSYFGFENIWGSKNPIYKHCTDRKSLGISLEASKALFLNPDTLLVVPRSGEMIIFDLLGHEDAGRGWKRKRSGVDQFEVSRLGIRGPIATGLYRLGPWKRNGTLFWASHVGDSLFIKFTESSNRIIFKNSQRVPGQLQTMETDELDDELYGNSNVPIVEENTADFGFKFQVTDTLFSLAPIRDMSIGNPTDYSDIKANLGNIDFEIVACVGEAQSGALGIISRSVRPQIISSFDIEGIIEMWSVKCASEESFGYHSFLFLSKENSTLVLKAGNEFSQVKNSDFYTSGPTVTVNSVLQDSCIVQIEPNNILLLNCDGGEMAKESVGSNEVWIVSASVLDPFVLLLTTEGHLILYQVTNDCKIEKVFQYKSTVVSAASLYNDQTNTQLPTISQALANKSKAHEKYKSKKRTKVDMDIDVNDQEINSRELSGYYCSIYSEDGSLQIVTIPDFKQKFFVPNFDYLPNIAHDIPDPSSVKSLTRPNYDLNEILLVSLGPTKDRQNTYLILTTDQNEYAIYEIFEFASLEKVKETDSSRLGIRMARLAKNNICRDLKTYAPEDDDKIKSLDARPRPTFLKKNKLKIFDKIGLEGAGVYSGVFISGKSPVWLMMAGYGGVNGKLDIIDSEGPASSILLPSLPLMGKRYLRQHPMQCDGPINCFAPLHNINIPYGFVYLTDKGQLRMCQLPAQFNYDLEWPLCKVAIGKTPSKITHHFTSHTYVVATSTPTPFIFSKAQYSAAVAAGVIENGDELLESEYRNYGGLKDEERDKGMYWPETAEYKLELVSPVTWEIVDSIILEESEHITSVENVYLESKETASGKKWMLAIGTAYMRSEDLAIRGRLLIYDIIDVVPEIDNPQTCHKFKKICVVDEKSPITAISDLNGYLLVGLGAKIIIYSFEDSDLTGVAFYDINIFVTSLTTLKNLILAGDISKGLSFLVFQEEPPKIVLLGKDFYPMKVYDSEMIVKGDQLGFIVADGLKNLHIMAYNPYSTQSSGGQKLVSMGQIHLGHHVSKIHRLQLLSKQNKKEAGNTGEYGCVIGSSSGSISVVSPVSEKLYRRMYSLYSRMVTSLQHVGGLNPRGFRHVHNLNRPLGAANTVASGPPGPKGILDGDLLMNFLNLSFLQQQELANATGSSVERIMDDLLEISNKFCQRIKMSEFYHLKNSRNSNNFIKRSNTTPSSSDVNLNLLNSKQLHAKNTHLPCSLCNLSLDSASDYILDSEIGIGTYSHVRLAHHKSQNHDTPIIIKLLSKSCPNSLPIYSKETEILSNLNHPNIIHLYNFFETDYAYCIVLEYINGKELFDVIMNTEYEHLKIKLNYIPTNIPIETYKFQKTVFKQLLSACHYLHLQNIAHRDIKVENIMITKHDSKVTLIDFGLSSKVDPSNPLVTDHCGSFQYSPPEVIMRLPYNPILADVWALGIVLFILITGEFPFSFSADKNGSNTERKMFTKIAAVEYTFPRELDMEIVELIQSILVSKPDKRPTLDSIMQNKWLND